MRFAGSVVKAGRFWAAEVPMLRIHTQGYTRKDAYSMVEDAIESLVNKPGFRVTVYPTAGGNFEVGASDEAALIAFMLRRERARSGLTLAQVAKKLGVKSINAYARYEQGRAVPTISKLSQLYAAVAKSGDFVITESRRGVETYSSKMLSPYK